MEYFSSEGEDSLSLSGSLENLVALDEIERSLPKRHWKKAYSVSKSIQMLKAFELQNQLEALQEEEAELELEGVEVESHLRKQQDDPGIFNS